MHKKRVSVPLSSPGRQDAAPRRCTFASGPPPPLPPVPSPRATPWDPRAARSFAFAHAACTRPGWGGTGDSHRSSAAGAAQRAPTSSSCSAPQKPTRRFPPPQTRVRGPSHGPFCRTPLGCRSVPRSELRHALHTARARPPQTRTAPAPPRPLVRSVRAAPTRELTPKLRTDRFRGTQ